MRFIAAITDTPVVQFGLARVATQWGPITAEVAAAETDQEFVRLARPIDPAISQFSGREEALIALMRSTGAFDDDIRRAVTPLTELRLIAPAESFNREVNEFFNRVRQHMNVEDIDFDFINEGVMQRILKT